jgi:hypothetical protein
MPAKRRNPLPRIGARTLIVSRRGGGASNAGTGGDFVFFGAVVAGGKGLVEIAVVKGVAQTPVVPASHSFEAFGYALGVASGLSGGFGWNGAAAMPGPFVGRVGDESFESYADGAIADAALTAGTGWDGGAALPQPDAHLESTEDFESYAEGVASGATMTAGSGWNGDTALFAY